MKNLLIGTPRRGALDPPKIFVYSEVFGPTFFQNGAAPQPSLHGPSFSFIEGSVSNLCFFCT
ncbi:MAG: hypothetical protein QG657_3409, partial [Acidobacteriota bacterium]|nr:hypothetical protein [Acidobacteriota bacterium]